MIDLGVGLIGYGLGGRAFHAPYIASTPGLALRSVVSRDPARVHADWPAMNVVSNVSDLLSDPEIELVVVSSPDELHAEHALAALRAGKHVLVDKPFANSLAEAQTVAAEAKRRGLSLTVFHNRRWDADFLTLHRLVSEGRLGRIVHFESHFDRWRPVPAAGWKEARIAGSWLDLGPHLVDQSLVLFGMPQTITLHLATLREAAPAPDYFHAVLGYPGLQVVLHASKLVADNALRFAVHGTKGSWIKHGTDVQEAATVAGEAPTGTAWGVDPTEGVLTSGVDSQVSTRVPNEPGDYRQFWVALAQAVRGKGPNPVPADQALSVMAVLEAGLRSAQLGQTIHL